MRASIFTTILIAISVIIYAQNPSMTISHMGLTPSNTLTVYTGDSIDFFYGGGGSHPMMEGWQSGETSSPNAFITQTVTSSNPATTFTINIPGTYYFHCGTNPGNNLNWGKIIVLSSSTSVNKIESVCYNIYPNPSANILTIEGLTETAEIFSLTGAKVMDVNTATIDVTVLPKGLYILRIGAYSSTFIIN